MLLSTALDALYEKLQGLGKQKFWFLYLGILFIIVTLINGLGIVPEEPYQRLSQNPFATRTDIHFNNYWQETLLLPLLAYYLGMTGTIKFNVLVFAIFVGGFCLFAWLIHRRWGSTLALISTALLITSPLTTIFLSWLGTPDGLTFVMTVPFLFINSGAAIFFLSILGAANHPAFIVAALEILILRWTMRDEVNIKHLTFAMVGIIFGYATVKLFLFVNSIELVSRFDFMQLKDLGEWFSMNAQNLPTTLFSLFNIHWLILPISMIMFFKKDRRFFSFVILMLLLNYGLVFFTLDTTRVFILTSWGVLFMTIIHSYKLALSESGSEGETQEQYIQALLVIVIVSVITPRFFSWVGEIHVSPYLKNIGNLLP